MSKFVVALAVFACTWCVSETAKAQDVRIYTQLPNCPGRWILDERDEANDQNLVHCECADGSHAFYNNDDLYCISPQSQTTFQQPIQTDPAQEMINNMLGNAASQFGSQIETR